MKQLLSFHLLLCTFSLFSMESDQNNNSQVYSPQIIPLNMAPGRVFYENIDDLKKEPKQELHAVPYRTVKQDLKPEPSEEEQKAVLATAHKIKLALNRNIFIEMAPHIISLFGQLPQETWFPFYKSLNKSQRDRLHLVCNTLDQE